MCNEFAAAGHLSTASSPKGSVGAPSVYIFYGDDPLSISETLEDLREKLGPSADFNSQRFSGRALSLEGLEQACNSLPFLSNRRLVVLENAEALPRDEAFRQRFERILNQLPESTALVLVEQIDTERPKIEREQRARSIGLAWAEAKPEAAYVRKFPRPRGSAFAHWLQARAESLGGQLEQEATQLLAELVAEDVLIADQELRKLLDYVDHRRAVTAQDIESLTPFYGQADVFAVVDRLGAGPGWLDRLEKLLQDHDPAYVFAMIVRQFRLLIQARAALDDGVDPVGKVQASEFVAKKVSAQARSFTAPVLKGFYHRLLQLDLAVKRGEAELALDLVPLMASLTR